MLGSSGVTLKQLCYFVPMSAASVSEVQHRQIKIKSAAASTVWPFSANLGCTCMNATLACSAVVLGMASTVVAPSHTQMGDLIYPIYRG